MIKEEKEARREARGQTSAFKALMAVKSATEPEMLLSAPIERGWKKEVASMALFTNTANAIMHMRVCERER